MIVELSEDRNLVGNKAANLYKAKKLNLNIPKSVVITTDIFEEYIKDKNIVNKILDQLEKYLENFKRPLIFRSSATVEDTVEKSYAGVFKSVLNIYTKEDMKNAIKTIYQDFISKNINGKIAILIQEQFNKGKFGVMFGFDDKIVLEVTINDPEGITKGNAKIKDLYIIEKDNYYIHNNRNWNILFDTEINKIKEIDKELRKIYYPYDAEFVIYRGEFYLLQIRPLTKKPKLNIGKSNLYGIGVSYGKAIGRVTFSDENYGKDKILVEEEIPFDEIDKIKNFGGVIIELGSLLSHISIHAREYNIPAIIGVPKKFFREGELIEINGETGEIKFLEREGFELPKIEKEVEIVDPRKLQLIIIDKYSFLLYPKDGYKIVYHRDNRGLDILLKLSKDPLVDGGEDNWHTYSNILELSLLDSEIKKDFKKAVEVVDKGDINKMRELYKIFVNKVKEYYKYAKENKDIYYAEKVYSYIRIIDTMVSNYGQKLRNNKEYIEFVKEIERDYIPEFKDIYYLFDEIYGEIKDKYKIDRKDYTSNLSFLLILLKNSP